MTKKGAPMDIWFQWYNLYRLIECYNLKDLQTENLDINPKLTFPENWNDVKNNWKNFL